MSFESLMKVIELVGAGATTMVAAYYGARVAFEFQDKKEAKVETGRKAESVNLAIFELVQAHHELTAVLTQYIAPEATKPDRHFSIRPSSSKIAHLELDFSSLSFLFESSNADFLNSLALAQSDVNALFDQINSRAQIHASQFQPILDGLAAPPKTLAELEGLVGKRLTITLREMTDDMVDDVPEVRMLIEEKIREFRSLTKEMLPGQRLINLTFRDPS